MRVEICSFSGFKIHPGHGSILVQNDMKTIRLFSKRCHSYHTEKTKPHDHDWTVFARRKNKKGIVEETETKVIKKASKEAPRAVAGMSAEDIERKKREVAERRKKEAKK
ncbi:MAG: 60S ribosomal protein L24 [Amphiamblys sp. WSBS2006]|nr:MAG: 60S ribosomal protein L24 [Amphiamblys sp. WSBS2006]